MLIEDGKKNEKNEKKQDLVQIATHDLESI